MKNELPALFKTHPAVFAAGHTYQIMVPVNAPALFRVEVGDHVYYDHSNGIMRSNTSMHRVEIPAEVLDAAGSYTVVYRKIIERKPYYPTSEEDVRTTYAFYPVHASADKPVRFYHLADVHGRYEQGRDAGKYFGDDLDFLVMNGDILDHSGAIENFDLLFRLASDLTGGEKPVLTSRGNHDLRGFYAENLHEYMPNINGKTYYTARLGDLWFLVLDCAEDKADDSVEYGHTIACHPYREDQTAFVRQVIAHADEEYNAPGVTHRYILSHVPFTMRQPAPFDIEDEIYTEWCTLIAEHIHPELMICGHLHEIAVFEQGGPNDNHGQCCPVVIAADLDRGGKYLGGAFTVTKDMTDVQITNSDGGLEEHFTFPSI